MQDAWRAYLELALGLTESSKKKAQQAAQRLVGKGGATAAQLQGLADDLLATGTANRTAVTKLVRSEVERALGRVGLVTSEEVTDLAARVAELEREVGEARAAAAENAAAVVRSTVSAGGPGSEDTLAELAEAARAAAGPTVTEPAAAKKAAAKKATAKKAAAKKATAKKAAAKKAVATKAVAEKAAPAADSVPTPGDGPAGTSGAVARTDAPDATPTKRTGPAKRTTPAAKAEPSAKATKATKAAKAAKAAKRGGAPAGDA